MLEFFSWILEFFWILKFFESRIVDPRWRWIQDGAYQESNFMALQFEIFASFLGSLPIIFNYNSAIRRFMYYNVSHFLDWECMILNLCIKTDPLSVEQFRICMYVSNTVINTMY